jgi:hypothetical protein
LDPTAAAVFGFASRPGGRGLGDNNGIIEGFYSSSNQQPQGFQEGYGETELLWNDLFTAGLTDWGSQITTGMQGANISGAALANWFPPAKVGTNNFVAAYSYNSVNYWQVSKIYQLSSTGAINVAPAMTVRDAYMLDQKIDDGLPQTGNVTANIVHYQGGSYETSDFYLFTGSVYWYTPIPFGAIGPSITTCFDNGGNASTPAAYSVGQNNGIGVNCSLSFRFQ